MVTSPRFASLGRFRRVGLIAVAVAVLVPLLLLAIGWLAGRGDRAEYRTTTTTISPTAAARPAGSAASGSLPGATTAAGIAAPAAAATAAPASGGRAGNTSDVVGQSVPVVPTGSDQLIIRTGAITLTVKDVLGTQAMIWNMASEMQGFVTNSSASGTGDAIRGEITLRVPADRYRDAMDRLRGYAVKVENEKSTAQDVSEEYVDLKGRRDNLELTVRQLQSLLGQARTVDEALKVQSQLTNVQNDLERIKGRMNYLDNRASFSTITASLLPVLAEKKPETKGTGWSFVQSVTASWERSLRGLQNVADLLIAIIVGGWWLLIPLAIAATYIVRRLRRVQPTLQPAIIGPPAPPADASA